MGTQCDICQSGAKHFYRVQSQHVPTYYAARCSVHMKSDYFESGGLGFGLALVIISEHSYIINSVLAS